jgi:MFS family permease
VPLHLGACGVLVAGVQGGATLMAVEHAPPGRRGFFGAFPQMGAPAGVGLATIAFFAVSQLDPEQFLSWGWRLPFLFSAVLVVVGLVIRLSIAESPEFEKVREAAVEIKMPIAEAFRRHPREIFLVAGTYLSQGVLAYICMSYLVSFATTQVGIPRPQVLMGVFVAAVIATVLYPVFGSLADRWGRKTIYLLGAVLMLVSIIPAFALINTGNAVAFGAALVLVFGIAMAPAGGVTGSLFSMIFTPEVRYSGASVGYTISQISGAAFAPLIATALFAIDNSTVPVVGYLLVVCAISVVSVLLLPGTLGKADPLTTVQHSVNAH